MSQRVYVSICAFLFLVIALAHLARLLRGWEVVCAGRSVPVWASLPGFIITLMLSAWGFRAASRMSKAG